MGSYMRKTLPSPRPFLSVVVALLLFAPVRQVGQAAIQPPEPIGLAFEASWHGDFQALAGSGNYLYLSQAGDLVIFDRTAPNGRQQISSQDLGGDVIELQVSGDTLLALVQRRSVQGATEPLSLALLSLADPAAPQPIGNVAGFEPVGLSVAGAVAYSIGTDGTVVIVTSDGLPGSPHIERFPLGTTAAFFVAHGSYLYVATSAPDAVVLKVFMHTPGSAPHPVTEINTAIATVNHDTPDIVGIAIMGNVVMVSYSGFVTQYVYGHVSFDISAPGAPTVTTAGTEARSATESGNIAYVTLPPLNGFAPSQLWDISDRSHPTLVGQLYSPPTSLGQIVGDRYYFAGPAHLSSIPLGQIEPTIERHLEQNPISAWRIRGDRLYTIDRHDYDQMVDAFKVYDVADPARPALIASIPDDSAMDMVVGDNYVVTAAGGYQRTPSWTIYDVTTPTPTWVFSETSTLPIYALALDGSNVAMLRSNGVRLYDLTTTPPTLTATAAVAGTSIELSETLAWVINSPAGTVRAIDFSTPQSPVISAPLDFTPFSGSGSAARGTYLYLGTGAAFSVAEHHANGSITWLSQLPISDSTYSIQSIDLASHAALVGTLSQCVIVDLSQPAAPIVRSTGSVRSQPCPAQWAGTDIVVGPSSTSNGIQLFRPFALGERTWLPVIGALGP